MCARKVITHSFPTDYNKQYFPDPEEFKPSRWYNARENDMTMFSLGSRACKYFF